MKKWLLALWVFLLLVSYLGLTAQSETNVWETEYRNPIIEVNDLYTWSDYGVGDPFVMRWNGRYYLYCSTKDGEIGIQCWQSDDLVYWEYRGLCAQEPLTMSAYAPEVVYHNGYFYMYTSPAGNGHYVLKSESPTGPFYAVTDNFGLSIDGNVFVDDDGAWYFYSAANHGIMVYPMSAPDRVNAQAGKKIACDMNGWTEGSMVVKHDGAYYMTYTGNHVWSSGYRIHYAVGTDPLTFTPAPNNPLLLSTNDETVKGIGHSSTVLGPNLDEYYLVYHSHKTIPQRSMNIDRIVFNGTNTVVLGPTTQWQEAPKMPDVYSRFEKQKDLTGWLIRNGRMVDASLQLSADGTVLSEMTFTEDYTAEVNVKSLSGKAGMVFGYRDTRNFATAMYNADTQRLEVSFTVDGVATTDRVEVAHSFNEALDTRALMVFTVRKSGNEYVLFLNNRELFRTHSALGSGAIGAICEEGEATIGFVGATGGAWQSTLSDVQKPITSRIPTFAHLENGKNVQTEENTRYVKAKTNDSYSYTVKVTEEGTYDLVITYRSQETAVLHVLQNGVSVGEVSLSGTNGQWSCITKRGMALDKGTGTVILQVKTGNVELLEFSFHQAEAVVETYDDFSAVTYANGDWQHESGQLVLYGGNAAYGKWMTGSENWGDYVVESEITPLSDNINVGLCVRVSNPSTREPGANQHSAGSDYLQGYFIGLSNGSVVLGKHNYDWQELQRVTWNIQKGNTYRVKAEVKQNVFTIYVDDVLLMRYTDSNSPFLHGMVGYRAHASAMMADRLRISPITSLLNGWTKEEGRWCYYSGGKKLTNQWLKDSVGWCYVGADGYCVTNAWKQDSIGWVYLDTNGRMLTNRWVKDSVGWCYVGSDGYAVTNAWKQDSIGWVYLDTNGRMLTNRWVKDSVGWCYVGAEGYAVTNTWKKDSYGWCYLNENGSMAKSRWVNSAGKWYYLNGDGYMVTGRVRIGGAVHVFGADGIWQYQA